MADEVQAAKMPPVNVSIPQALRAALEHHQTGRLAQAETIYRQILKVAPNHPDALHLLGLIARQAGDNKTAAELISKAISVHPSDPRYYNNLGNALKDLGKLDAAVESYRRALALKPDYTEALYNSGNALKDQGKLDAAIDSYRQALALRPDFLDAHSNMGNVLKDQGKFDEAVTHYIKVLSLKPDIPETHSNLGIALQALGNLDMAVEHYHKALALKPDYADAHSNLGTALHALGDFDTAVEHYHKALALTPDYAEAHGNLGNALKSQGKLEAAAENYRKAISLKPDYAKAHCNLGNVLMDQGMLEAAVESYRKALSLQPHFAEAYSNLLYLYASTRYISPESECEFAANWENIILDERERTAARNRALSFSPSPRAGRKLKIGVVSAELGQHAAAEYLEPFLEQVDRSRFHITLYPTTIRRESRADRFRKLADEYKLLVGLPDSKAAELIRSDRIDVLIDTTGHMGNCRLGIFALRAAPVQCHYIYHGTTGLTEMDWFIADEVLLPPSCDSHFSEKIWRLPRLWMSYRGDTSLPDSNWQPDPDGTIWLGSFNNLTKVREQTLALWAKVMAAMPESMLLLKDSKSDDPSVQERIRTELARHGISGERVEFIGWTPDWSSHMAMYDRLDIALDTIPLNSETTASDALWMGVPLVGLEGNWLGGRMASAKLKALGKPEWVAQSEDAYVAIVAALARDVEGRKELRKNQRTLMKNSQVCDANNLSGSLENAFEAMFDLWLAKRDGAS